MSTDLVRCHKCRGQKQYAGLGGIFKDCEPCDGSGKVELIKLKPVPIVDSIDALVEPVAKIEECVHVPEIVSVAEAFKSMVVPEAVIAEVAAIKDVEPLAIQEMVIDRMMEACLAEPTLTTEDWKAKYPDVAESTSIRDRHSMRIVYAQSKPIAPRTVDLSKTQDDIAKADPEYAAFQAQEKRLIEREEAKNKNKKGEVVKNVKDAAGIGGV